MDDKLVFLPLGGTGEIGMNLNLYHLNGQWMMVDCGVMFGDQDLAAQGYEVITPDPEFLKSIKGKFAGLVLTHAHEDHIGAIPWLWEYLKDAPIYGTKFSLLLVYEKLKELGLHRQTGNFVEYKANQKLKVGPFSVTPIHITHSIPESNALLIRSSAGNILHTGDWKFDRSPLIEKTTDFNALRQFADEGILALIGDSTNAPLEGRSGSEGVIRDEIVQVCQSIKEGIIYITCFASNVARVHSILQAAHKSKRSVYLAGRSFRRYVSVAQKCGYLPQTFPFVTDREVADIPARNLIVLCTGSQGEPRAALGRICEDKYEPLWMNEEDTVIFSSRLIPGNEDKVMALYDKIHDHGARLITADDNPVHVSGHPAKEELIEMITLAKPQMVIPTHGTPYHMEAHAKIAQEVGVPMTGVFDNGDMVWISKDGPVAIDRVHTGRMAVWKGGLVKV